MMQHRANRLFAGFGHCQSFFHLTQLNFGHHAQYVILALEIVEERAFTDISGFGDIFDRDIGVAALGKKLKRATEQAHPSFGATTLAPPHALQVRQTLGVESLDGCGVVRSMTFSHE